MKKVLSLVLVIAMVLSSMSFAFADTFEDVTGDYEKAINTLAGLGIITGYEDGTFRPERVVTRAEMAKLMVEILGYGDLVAGAKSNFSDTQGHWADSWIAIAAGRNIVIGTGDGKFTPDRQVSYDEVLTMIVRGLGYTDDSNEIKSMTWPTNFKVKAAEIGVTDGVKMATAGADRGGVAQALFNALDATLVTVDVDGNVRNLQDNKQRDLPLITRIAVVRGNEDSPFRVNANHLNPNHKDYAGDIVDLEQYLYEDVEAYGSRFDKDIIVYVAESFSDTVVGTVKAHLDSSDNQIEGEIKIELEDKDIEYLDWDEKTVKVYYNGKEVNLTEEEFENGNVEKDIIGTVGTKVAKVKVVEIDDYDDDMDGDVRAVVVTNPTYAQRVASGYKKDATTIGRISLPTKGDGKVDLSKVTVTGAVDDINDIEDGDVVVAYAAGGAGNTVTPSKTKLVVVRDALEGTITKVNKATDGSTTIYVDGEKYTRSEIPGRTDTFDVGFEGTFFLDDSGRIFAEDATSIADAKDYAIVIQTYNGVKSENGRTLANAEIKVLTAGGEVVTYKVDKDTRYVNVDSDGKEVLTKVINDTATTLNFYGSENETTELTDGTGDYLNRALIKIKVGSDNVVDRIDVVEPYVIGSKTKSNVDTTVSSFEVAQNAPIFNIDQDGIVTAGGNAKFDKKYYSVVDVEDLPKFISFEYSDHNSSGAYKVIVSTDADKSSIGTFALITNVDYVLNGSTTKVAEITAMVDGAERVFYGENRNLVIGDVIDNGTIVELTVSGNEVSNITTVTTPVAISGVAGREIERVGAAGIRVNGSWYALNEDVNIYVLNKDKEYVGTTDVSDVAGYQIVGLYNTNTAQNADGAEILVVKPYQGVVTPGTPGTPDDVVEYKGTYTLDGNRYIQLGDKTYPYVGDYPITGISVGDDVVATFTVIRGETVVTGIAK